LILFDFDDTLVCSTFLTHLFTKQTHNADNKKEPLMQNLEFKAMNLLNLSLAKGTTKIVSNAEHAWINYVLDNFFPVLRIFIKTKQIEIVSARQLYQDIYPQDSFKWKEDCFRQEIKESLSTTKDKDNFMLVSIGDGLFERIACKIIAAEFNIPYCSLKLLDSPSPQLLCHQLDVIHRCFNELIINPLNSSAQSKQNPMVTQAQISRPSVHHLCNDLFFDFNRDRSGICIYHWEKRLENSDPDPADPAEDGKVTHCVSLSGSITGTTPSSSSSSASEEVKDQTNCDSGTKHNMKDSVHRSMVQSEEAKCHLMRTACLEMAGQVTVSFGAVTTSVMKPVDVKR
jgi:hypothetical protein